MFNFTEEGLVDRTDYPTKEEIIKYMSDGNTITSFEYKCKKAALGYHLLADFIDSTTKCGAFKILKSMLSVLRYYADDARYLQFQFHKSGPLCWEFRAKIHGSVTYNIKPLDNAENEPWMLARNAYEMTSNFLKENNK